MCRLSKLKYSVFFLLFFNFVSCKNTHRSNNQELVTDASQMNGKVKSNIEDIITAAANGERLHDSTLLLYYPT